MKKLYLTFLIACVSIYTKATVIYVNDDAAGTNNGSSWTDAYTDLQAAITASTSGDTIAIAGGTYKPHVSSIFVSFELKEGIKLIGGFVGNETVNAASIAARDLVTNETILSGDLNGDDTFPSNMTDNSYHVLYADVTQNITAACELNGLTVSGGNAIGNDPYYLGGGLFIDGYNAMGGGAASPSFKYVTFKNNAAAYGGAVCMVAFPSTGNITMDPSFENCLFEDNHAVTSSQTGSAAGGGAINIWAGSNSTVTPSVFNTKFLDNSVTTTSDYGGAIHYWSTRNSGAHTLTLDSVQFCDNDAYYGSAIYVRSGSSGLQGIVNITMTDATITSSSYGRSIYNNIDVSGSTIGYNVTNSILWANGQDVYNTGGQVDANFAYCIIEGSGGSTSWDQTYGTDGGNNADVDPLVVETDCDPTLYDNSPAIGAGASGENIGYYQGAGIIPFTMTTSTTNDSYCEGVGETGSFSVSITDENLASVTVTYTSSDSSIVDPTDFLITTTSGVSDVSYVVGSGIGTATITIKAVNSGSTIYAESFTVTNNLVPVIDSVSYMISSSLDTTYCVTINSNYGVSGAQYYIFDEDTLYNYSMQCGVYGGDHMAYVSNLGCIDSMSYALDTILANVSLSISLLSNNMDTACIGDTLEYELVVVNESFDNVTITPSFSGSSDIAWVENRNDTFYLVMVATDATYWDPIRSIMLQGGDDKGDYDIAYTSFYGITLPNINTVYSSWENNCVDLDYSYNGNGDANFSIDGGTTWQSSHLCEVYNWVTYDVITEVTDGAFTCVSDVIFTFKMIGNGNVEVGIEEESGMSVDVYPNPSSDQITISGIAVNTKLELTNVLGETVYSTVANTDNLSIDISNYERGIYMLRSTNENQQTITKIIIE